MSKIQNDLSDVLKTLDGILSRIGTQAPEDSMREIVTVLKTLTAAVRYEAGEIGEIEDRLQEVEERQVFPVSV